MKKVALILTPEQLEMVHDILSGRLEDEEIEGEERSVELLHPLVEDLDLHHARLADPSLPVPQILKWIG